jgi:PiT family inorganic phosphate transporter
MGSHESAEAPGRDRSMIEVKSRTVAAREPETIQMDRKARPRTRYLFLGLLSAGILFTVYSLYHDINAAHVGHTTWLPFILLGLALTIALGFEFVNGFHDTANAVATVIYTHSLPPAVAVIWSGICNFTGVLISSGAVAFGIISLLPVELILQVGSSAGFAMVFALLIAAIIWNLGTWWLCLPASSSHTLIGSIIGVGVANALVHGQTGTSGVDWASASTVGWSLLVSPLVGFVAAGLLFLALKLVVRDPRLYRQPDPGRPPPFWIRAVLILTCTGVSLAHGSNDGQKGMGLIMLILIGTVPLAFALNRSMPPGQIERFQLNSHAAAEVVLEKSEGQIYAGDPRPLVTRYIAKRQLTPQTYPALSTLMRDIAAMVGAYGSLARLPADAVANTRNDMYLASEALRFLVRDRGNELDPAEAQTLGRYKQSLDDATKFIPTWVKIAVAVALGLGTMVGWKRIVVTVGERIGKSHMTYGQGASAEFVAMTTIGAADLYGLPVSTTHVLASGVAGTMAANRSGLQWSTVRSLALAWVLTLPAAILLSGSLYLLLRALF